MKIRRDDRLKVDAAGTLQLLYFASGRQETWKGPVTLTVGDRESTPAADQEPLLLRGAGESYSQRRP